MKPSILHNDWNKHTLWNGCMLASIAHAIMVAHYPELSYEHSWDGRNYSMVDGSGTRGTVTFHDQYCVAAFRNERVVRREFSNALDYFQGASPEIIELAKHEALDYLLDEIDKETTPLITTAFWSENDHIVSLDNMEKFLQNGGSLLERQWLGYETAVRSWEEYYEMTEAQLHLLQDLYKKKLARPHVEIVLTNLEIRMLGTDEPEGLEESETSFNEIGIVWE